MTNSRMPRRRDLALSRVVSLLAALMLLMSGVAARAEIAGQADPRFQAALTDWLADDDAAALPAFAALAAEENRAAQILLALIDVTPAIQGPWLAALPRAERISLMRAPGGISGQSWMRTAAEDTPLAQLWILRWDAAVTAEADTALAFAAMGEARAARETLLAMGARQRRGFAAIADDPLYPPELRYLVWGEWAADPLRLARIDAEMAAALPGDPQLGFHDARPAFIAQQDEWLATASLAAPLREFCAATCPESYRSCARAAVRMLGRNELCVFALGSPSETLVPAETWNSSPRGLMAILRQALSNATMDPRLLADVAGIDRCAAGALAGQTELFAR